MWGWRLVSWSVLLLATVVSVPGCGDSVTPAPVPVAVNGSGPEPGPPPVVDEPGPPPVVDEPGPPPVVESPSRPPDDSKPIRPPPPEKAFEIVTRQDRRWAIVAAGVVLDKTLISDLADAGGLSGIDVAATRDSMLKVVPVIRRFPQLTVDFAAGRWTPRKVILNERTTTADLRAVASMREVRWLDLSACRVGDSELVELVELDKMVGLESLRLPPTTSDGIGPVLVRLRSLKHLSLEATRVTAATVAVLPRGLESLNLSGTTIDDAAIEHLRRLPGLRQLWLDETPVGDKSLTVVSTRTTIETLGLTGTGISSEGIKQLAGLANLTALHLAETAIDDEALGVLISMKQLKFLDVTETGLSVDARQTLVGSLRPSEVHVDRDALVQALDDTNGRMELALARIARVTRNSDGQVVALNIFDPRFSDIGMERLRQFTSLKRLSVEGTAVTDEGIKSLSAMTQLEELWLGNTVVGDTGLEVIRSLRSLRQLHLKGTRVTVSGVLSLWPALARVSMSFPGGRLGPGWLVLNRKAGPLELLPLDGLRGLQHLQLVGVHPGDAGLEHIAGLVELETLRLPRAGIQGPGLVHLHNLGGLQVLDLTGNPLDDLSSDLIPAWVELRELILDHSNVSSLAPFATAGRTALKRLSLAGTSINDTQLAVLPVLSNLELVDLTGCPVTDTGLAASVTRLPNLQALALGGTGISDAGVGKLAECSSLRVLRLSDTAVTSAGLSRLARLPQLTRLDLSGCIVDETTLKAVGRFEQLARVDLRRTTLSPMAVAQWRAAHTECEVIYAVDPLLEALADETRNKPVTLDTAVRQVAEVEVLQEGGVSVTVTDADLTDVGVARLATYDGLTRLVLNGVSVTSAGLSRLELSRSLKVLDLSSTSITDHASTNLSRLVGLTELSLADTEFSDRGLARLEGLEKLESLDLAGLAITANGLTAALPRFTALRHVNLAETWIVNADLRVLGTVKNLDSLSLRDTVISDRGVPAILALKSLKKLWIERTRISEMGLQKLKKGLPGCEVFGP